MKLALLLIVSLLTFSGCTHTVNYKLTEQDRWTGSKINQTVAVGIFADKTAPETKKVVEIDKDSWRTNYRSRYSSSNLIAGVSAMIARQLAHSGLFADVVSRPTSTADCVLSGTLVEYSSLGRVNSGAETTVAVASGFGLIGGIVGATSTAGAETEIRVSVRMDDLKLTGKSGEVLWRDSINVQTNFTTHFQAAKEGAIFIHADNALKTAVGEMIHRIGIAQATNQVSAGR